MRESDKEKEEQSETKSETENELNDEEKKYIQKLILNNEKCMNELLSNIYSNSDNNDKTQDKIRENLNQLVGREKSSQFNNTESERINALLLAYPNLNLNSEIPNFEKFRFQLANILNPVALPDMGAHGFSAGSWNPFSGLRNMHLPAIGRLGSFSGFSGFSGSSGKWLNPLNWGKSSHSSSPRSSSSRSWNPFRGKSTMIPAGRLPSATWPKNEEQYGYTLPESNYKDVPAPEGYYVASAFVAMQTFLSQNYTLTIMCILLFIATAALIAGIYLNIREHRQVEQEQKDQKLNMFKTAHGAIQADNIRNKKPVIFHEVNPHKLNYSMFVDTYPPKPYQPPKNPPKPKTFHLVKPKDPHSPKSNTSDDYNIQYV